MTPDPETVERVKAAIAAALNGYMTFGRAGNNPSAVYRVTGDWQPVGEPVFVGGDAECIAYIHGVAARAALSALPGWYLPASAINDLQDASIAKWTEAAKGCGRTDLIIHADTGDREIQADWFKHLRRLPAPPKEGE